MHACMHACTGEEWRGRPGLAACVRVLRADFFAKVVTRHDTGLGEAYMDGDFEVRHPTPLPTGCVQPLRKQSHLLS